MTGVVGSGALLSILSRLEERTPGLSAGVSSDATWVAVAFAIGSSRQSARGGAAGGAVTLTAANLRYYGRILTTESTDPAAVAGSTLALADSGPRQRRALPRGRRDLADGLTAGPNRRGAALLGGSSSPTAAPRGAPASDAISVVAAVTLACTSASTPRLRCLASAACALRNRRRNRDVRATAA